MLSSGTGSDISGESAAELLHKLITESTKVQAVFKGPGSVSAAVSGLVRPGPGGLLMVKLSERPDDPFLIFDPRSATSFKYGDTRAFPSELANKIPNAPKFVSVLSFLFPDNSYVMLFEVAADE